MSRFAIILTMTISFAMPISAGNDQWDLNRCLAHAREKNITILTLKLDKQSDEAAWKKARAARVPDLRAGTSYSVSANNIEEIPGSSSSFNGSQSILFSLNSAITLFDGFRTRNDIEQKKIRLEQDDASIEKNVQTIEIAVTQAYLQALFAHESLKNAESSIKTSAKQLDYTQERYKVGSASIIELEQMRAQTARVEYELVLSQNNLSQRILELKQLLELPPVELFKPYFPTLQDSIRLPELPDKEQLFHKALESLPQIKESKRAIEVAEKEKKKSIGGYYPTLTLSGGISSRYFADDRNNFSTQMTDNFSPGAGVQLSVPLLDNKQTKTAIIQSDIAVQKAGLNFQQLEKTVLMDVEKAYQNCIAAYNSYRASIAQLKAAQRSYDLALQQHALGMLKPTDLLVQADLYNNALQELTQAKYTAILYYQLLSIYEGKRISLPEDFSLKE